MPSSVCSTRRVCAQQVARLALAAALVAAPLASPIAAQGAPTTAPAQAPPMPSIALPPELDRVLRDYERHWRASDAAALAALFTEDGFILQSNRPPVRGRAAIAERYASAGGALQLRALALAASDSLAVIIGAYGYGDGDTPEDQGKFTLTLRRVPGGPWMIFSDMDNSSRAPQMMRRTPGAP